MNMLMITLAIFAILLGLYALYHAFRLLFKIFRARDLEKVTFNALPHRFQMVESMTIGIWLEGPIGQYLSKDFSKPCIIESATGHEIKLQSSIARASKNSFSHARTLLFYADLNAGEYELMQSNQQLVSKVERHVSAAIQQTLNLSTAQLHQCRIILTEALSMRQRLSMIVYIFFGLFILLSGILTLLTHAAAMA